MNDTKRKYYCTDCNIEHSFDVDLKINGKTGYKMVECPECDQILAVWKVESK